MENKGILFSIIVPVYNTGKYIEKCLNSILDAIDIDCEVIIINDGSTDNSEKIILDFINKLPDKYKNNFIYKSKENKGLADTKNVGISLAKGKYISVVDSDDYISDDFYNIARKYINEGHDVIIYDLYVIYEEGYKVIDNGASNDIVLFDYVARAYKDEKKDFILGILCGAMQGSSCNKIIKKELYNLYEFPINKQYEDVAVTPFILIDAKKIKYVPYPLYYYLQRAKSIVAENTYISAFYKICENISKVLIENKQHEKYKEIINEFFIVRGLETLYDDYKNNKKIFLKNLNNLSDENKETLRYILDNDLINNMKNQYSIRQKNLLQYVYNSLLEKKYKNITKEFLKRRIVNYIRRVYKACIHLVKTLIGRE